MEYITSNTNTENKPWTSNPLVIGIIGSIIGGIIVYLILKSTNKLQPQLQTFNQLQSLQQPTPQPISQQSIIQQPVQTNNTLYKNNESWEIIRGKDGFISKLNVLRDVKLNN